MPILRIYIQLQLVCEIQRVYFRRFVFSFILPRMSYLSDRVVLLCEHQCLESIKFIFQIFKWFKDIKSRIFVFKKHKKHGKLFFNLNVRSL